ncbi:MAG: glycosyltransferase family 4 protein [Candidatus Krumholzibacteriia bacterium]
MRSRLRVLYFSRVDFPNRKANSIQTMNTCYELARGGAEVVLVVLRVVASRRQCFEFYALPEHPRLRFLSLSLPIESEFNDWQGSHFRTYLASFLQRYRTPSTVLFTRDPAGLELLRVFNELRPHPCMATVFEVHKVSFMVKASHQLERGRCLEDPRVRARIDERRALEAEVYGAADGLICTSESARRLVEENFRIGAPVCVIPNGTRVPVDAAGNPNVVRVLDDTHRDIDVLYVGQLYAWKGIDILLRAMRHLPGRRLTVVGGNDPQDLERVRGLVAAEGLQDCVELAGYRSPPEVRGYLGRARVGVVPSPLQGFAESTWFTSPLKLFELMQAGVPVVATDLPSIRELLVDGDSALLAPPDDPQAMARRIARLLEDRGLAARLVQRAAEGVVEYSWEKRARRILGFLNRLHPAVQQTGA